MHRKHTSITRQNYAWPRQTRKESVEKDLMKRKNELLYEIDMLEPVVKWFKDCDIEVGNAEF